MPTRVLGRDARAGSDRDYSCVPGASIGDVLRLLRATTIAQTSEAPSAASLPA